MTQSVIAGTSWVLPNEPCYLIFEIEKPAPDSKTKRRYRHIWVSRSDQLAEYVEDLGLASDFAGMQQSHIPTGGRTNGRAWSEHTVGEAIGMMEEYRVSHWDTEDSDYLPRLGDLVEGYEVTNEMRGRPKGRKVFAT